MISSLSLFIRYLCCSSFSHVVPSFVLSIGSAFRVRGAFHFREGGFFCTHSFCAAPTRAILVLLIYSFLGMALCANTSIRCRFAFPFFIFAFALAYIPCVDSDFQSAVTVTAFTTTSFTWWPGATKFISVAVLPSVPLHSHSVCPVLSAARLNLPTANQRRKLATPH